MKSARPPAGLRSSLQPAPASVPFANIENLRPSLLLLVRQATPILAAVWLMQAAAVLLLAFRGGWGQVIVVLLSFALTLAPLVFALRARVRLTPLFRDAIGLFMLCTLVLGEAFGFYLRFRFWDLALHVGSAAFLGLVGAILLVAWDVRSRQHRLPMAGAAFAFCFAIAGGTIWEVFEFGLDTIFGLNTQKDFVNTMLDLVANLVGASAGAMASYAYFKGSRRGPACQIAAFVELNGGFLSIRTVRDTN